MNASLQLTLPGKWFAMPLGAPDADARLRAFTREAVGSLDSGAAMRARMHSQLREALEGAKRGKAEQLHLGLMLAKDVPLPAAITVFPAVAVATTQSHEPAVVMDAFVPRIMQAEHGPLGGTPTAGDGDVVFTRPDRSVLRRTRIVYSDDRPDAMSIDYWQTVPSSNRVQLIHVSIADAVATELFTRLFDEIVFASRYPRPKALADELRGSQRLNSE